MGYNKAKSKASITSGAITGAISILIGILGHFFPKPSLVMGIILGLAVSIIFIMRYQKTKKPMPAIPMMIISDLVALTSILLLILNK